MKITSLIIAGIFGTSMAVQGAVAVHNAVVYQSDFSGGTLASAGLESSATVGGSWDVNAGNVEFDSTGGNSRAHLYTSQAWANENGFTLDVTFNQIAAGARFSIGLVDASAGLTIGQDWLNQGPSGRYGIGLSTSGEMDGGAAGALAFNNGSGSSVLSTGQGGVTFNTLQTFSMTITETAWSYNINGGADTTGALAIDLDRSYRFVAYAQRGSNLDGSFFSNIQVRSVAAPEPSSLALLGLGGLLLAKTQRKRKLSKNL